MLNEVLFGNVIVLLPSYGHIFENQIIIDEKTTNCFYAIY